MTDKPEIEERENGPLVVKGIHRMMDAEGIEVEVKPVMALCRCGKSKDKPFCDGSHNDAGFQSRGGEPAGKDKILTYKGAEVAVTYNPMVCSHAAECVRMAGEAFDPEARPWIQPDKVSAERVREVVAACPSGALAMVEGDGREHLFTERAEIVIQRHGPYWVQNVPPPCDLKGEGMTERKYVLCRCGMSGNKPYCDGSHRDQGWRDDYTPS
ncbi:MAG: CDGSH iron-sulfur domain-containing protein [Pseudomonadota bacterium]